MLMEKSMFVHRIIIFIVWFIHMLILIWLVCSMFAWTDFSMSLPNEGNLCLLMVELDQWTDFSLTSVIERILRVYVYYSKERLVSSNSLIASIKSVWFIFQLNQVFRVVVSSIIVIVIRMIFCKFFLSSYRITSELILTETNVHWWQVYFDDS